MRIRLFLAEGSLPLTETVFTVKSLTQFSFAPTFFDDHACATDFSMQA